MFTRQPVYKLRVAQKTMGSVMNGSHKPKFKHGGWITVLKWRWQDILRDVVVTGGVMRQQNSGQAAVTEM